MKIRSDAIFSSSSTCIFLSVASIKIDEMPSSLFCSAAETSGGFSDRILIAIAPDVRQFMKPAASYFVQDLVDHMNTHSMHPRFLPLKS